MNRPGESPLPADGETDADTHASDLPPKKYDPIGNSYGDGGARHRAAAIGSW